VHFALAKKQLTKTTIKGCKISENRKPKTCPKYHTEVLEV